MILIIVYGLGQLTQHGISRSAGILIVAVVIFLILFSPKGRAWIGTAAVLLWLIWSFVYPVYQSVNRTGGSVPEQIWAAVKEAAIVGGKRFLEWSGTVSAAGTTVFDTARSFREVQEELEFVEQLCMNASSVMQRFPEEEQRQVYCQKQDARTPAKVKAYIDALLRGVAGAAFPFIAGDPARLNSDHYFECLKGMAQNITDTRDCYRPEIYRVPLKRRLCMELAIQVTKDDLLLPAPLATEIEYCRKRERAND